MSTATDRGSFGDVSDAFRSLMEAQVRLASEMLESFTGVRVDDVARDLGRRTRSARSCEIPPPCWMPRTLGECTSHVAECRTACVELLVTNCDRLGRQVSIQASGEHAGLVEIEPATLHLQPFERRRVRACVSIPQGKQIPSFDVLLWVRGCREHLLRWNVRVGSSGMDSCHQVRVDDCPDYRHHWYDHFYCQRGCTHGRIAGRADHA
jgi:hypothetical protein